ncbi:DnaJ domain-containing protein [Besnoitia besnoiti]|uniref:DnaJ domain-containing protein n=1 Tax=Besnoitia besnoiti TaxID=94643 RepID=A0A2A9MLW2_BESBE|nr:DnaJ domain-containing protein [Besnoitia besnoiti]PFH37331.1 DnaJ domain-containing protein [Besnoitia besnoiti]
MAGAGEAAEGPANCPLPEMLLGFCPYAVLGIVPPPQDSAQGSSSSSASGAASSASSSSAQASGAACVFFASVSVKTLASSYRRAALRAHPDKNRGREEEAAQEFVRIQAAYSFLSCEDSRAAYHAFLERQERHGALLAERRRRGLQADEKKRKFAEELKQREEAFAQAQKKAQEEAKQRGAGAASEKERLQRMRERNEKLIEAHQESLNAKYAQQAQAAMPSTAAGLSGFWASPQAYSSSWNAFDFKRRKTTESFASHVQPQPPVAFSDASHDASVDVDDIEDILRRSVYVHWTVGAAAGGNGGGQTSEKGVASANAVSAEDAAASEAGAATVTPLLISSLFIPLHALYIFGYNADHGYALVAFATRERALESALEFQQQQRQNRRGLSGETKKKMPRLRVKIADQVDHLRERLAALQEEADAAGVEFARAAAKAAGAKSSRPAAAPATPDAGGGARDTQEPGRGPFSRPTQDARLPRAPELARTHPVFLSPPTVMTTASLAAFEEATLRQLRLAAAKKAMQETQRQPAGGAPAAAEEG